MTQGIERKDIEMSTTKNTFARKALASVGAAALGLMGIIGLSATAMAEVPVPVLPPGQSGAPETGSLTLHKYAGPQGNTAPGGESQTITDKAPVQGVTFTVYKVAETSFNIHTATAAQWDALADAIPTCPAEGAPTLPGFTLGGGVAMDETDANGMTTKTLDLGAYVVCETGAPAYVTTKASPFVVPIPMPNGDKGWNYNVHAYPKNEITGDGSKVLTDVTTTTATWTITSPVLGSSGLASNATSWSVTDTPGAGLAFQVPFTGSWSAFYTDKDGDAVTLATGVTGTLADNKASATFDFTWDLGDYPAGTQFGIVLTTDVKGELLPDTGTAVNHAGEWSDNAYFGNIIINKVAAGTEKPLAGAEFAVYADACPAAETATPVSTGTTDVNGNITFGPYLLMTQDEDGKWVGDDKTFCVVETKAPAGHVLPEGAAAYKPITLEWGSPTHAKVTWTQPNTPATGPELPITGANGTMLMTVGGVALIAVAGGLYMVNRRKAVQK